MYTNWTGGSGHPIWVHAQDFGPAVSAVFSFRQGGVSEPPWASFNAGLHVGDDASHVLKNRCLAADVIGGGLEDWVVGQQVHGTAVHVVSEGDRGRGGTTESPPIEKVDALVTNVPGITLVIMAADCVPILFHDPVQRVIGAAHSGWKGTVGHISREVLRNMSQSYGTDPKDVLVSLGPSIRQCCYEVDQAVQEPVAREFGKRPWMTLFHKPDKYMLSLQTCIRADLFASGILPEHVEDAGLCTACHTQALFSHRAERGRTGRQFGAIRLLQARRHSFAGKAQEDLCR